MIFINSIKEDNGIIFDRMPCDRRLDDCNHRNCSIVGRIVC